MLLRVRLALPVVTLLALAGCIVPVPLPLPEGVVPEGTPGTFRVTLDEGDPCGARDLRGLRGEPAAAVEGLRLARADGTPVIVRVIRFGEPFTEDFNPERVNIRIGADGRVATLDCG